MTSATRSRRLSSYPTRFEWVATDGVFVWGEAFLRTDEGRTFEICWLLDEQGLLKMIDP